MEACSQLIPDQLTCEGLVQQLPERILLHSRAVQTMALEMCDRLQMQGICMNRELIAAASLLHDICRQQKKHACVGAEKMKALGYELVAHIIAEHHDWHGDVFDECALVFLADKYIDGMQRVTLEQRFAHSLCKCTTKEALAAHERKYQNALRAERLYYRLLEIKNIQMENITE